MAYADPGAVETRTDFKASAKALVTDCLRLSMHFFHPIQQCAQQVYHTAIPLSPTSSLLHKSCLQSVLDNQLSCVSAFLGAPNTWGSLLRTINVRPSQLTCIAASAQRIISACEDNVNIYDAVTFVLRQSISTPETVTKIQDSPDGSILFFVHSFSVTMWDIQTGGLIHTFTTQSKINDVTTSTSHIACGLSDGTVALWNFCNREGSRCFWVGKPVVTIHWLSSLELAIATQSTLYIYNITIGEPLDGFSVPGCVWGMVYLEGENQFLVGDLGPGLGVGQEESSFIGCKRHKMEPQELLRPRFSNLGRSSVHSGRLSNPTLVAGMVVCIAPTNGVQLFDTSSDIWTSPPLLGPAASVAVSLNRNLVVQTKDSIQIFSTGILTSSEAQNNVRLSHIYSMGENHILCLVQPTRRLILLELETMRELHPDDNNSRFGLSLMDQSAFACALFGGELVAGFQVSVIMQAWKLGAPLPEWTGAADDGVSLSRLSPKSTRVITAKGPPQPELLVKDTKCGVVLAKLPIEDDVLRAGEVYDLIFDSETRFHLTIDGPGWHVQVPYEYEISASLPGGYPFTISRGEPVPLAEPRSTVPYTLDVNCEWVLDAKSRKVCWISPGDIRRGDGGHFWAGLSLVMVGDDGVVRKLTFKEPDY